MNKIYTIILLLIICSTTLFTGCQLAIETTAESGEDKLSGVFITIGDSRQQFYQTDSATNLQLRFKKSGEGFVIPSDSNRVYGVPSEDGTSMDFDMQGSYLGFSRQLQEEGSLTTLSGGEGLSDVKYAVNIVNEDEETVTCEATLYVNPRFRDSIYLSPVYTDPSGKVYMLPDMANGMSFSGSTNGAVYTQTIDQSTTATYNDNVKSEKSVFILRVSVVDAVEKVLVKEMNQKDELIRVTEVFPNSEDNFLVEASTDYVIVEEYFTNSVQGQYINRNVLTPLSKDSTETTNDHYCNFADEEGIITRKLIKFIVN